MHSADRPSPGAADAAAELDRLRQALGDVAHDLNNLMGLVSNHAQLLRFVANDRDKVVQAAERIVDAVLRGAVLAERLHALRNGSDAAPSAPGP